jgi:hypothetical protein
MKKMLFAFLLCISNLLIAEKYTVYITNKSDKEDIQIFQAHKVKKTAQAAGFRGGTHTTTQESYAYDLKATIPAKKNKQQVDLDYDHFAVSAKSEKCVHFIGYVSDQQGAKSATHSDDCGYWPSKDNAQEFKSGDCFDVQIQGKAGQDTYSINIIKTSCS